jgi:hypothetical protein
MDSEQTECVEAERGIDILFVFVPSLLGPPPRRDCVPPREGAKRFQADKNADLEMGPGGSKFARIFRVAPFQLHASFATALRREWLKSARRPALDQPKDDVAQAFVGAAQEPEHHDAAQPSERMISR